MKGVWVHTKTRYEETKNGRVDPDLRPMVGEISPNIMFCDGRQKISQMGFYGCKWVFMGADGYISNEASKNK